MSEQKPNHEVELRDRIVLRYRSLEGYQNISAALKVSKSTLASTILKWKQFGTTKTLPRAGYPAKLSNQGRRALVREVAKNPMVNLTELQSSSVEMGEPSTQSEFLSALDHIFIKDLSVHCSVNLSLDPD